MKKILGVSIAAVIIAVGSYSLGRLDGHVKGFGDGVDFAYAVQKAELVKRSETPLIVPVTEKPEIKEFWETRTFNDKPFFYSQYASPPLISECREAPDMVFDYIYANDGVYAFPVGDFPLEDIALFFHEPKQKPERFASGAEAVKI